MVLDRPRHHRNQITPFSQTTFSRTSKSQAPLQAHQVHASNSPMSKKKKRPHHPTSTIPLSFPSNQPHQSLSPQSLDTHQQRTHTPAGSAFPRKKKCMQKNFFSFLFLVLSCFVFFFSSFSFLINDDTHDDTFRYTISLFNLIFIIALFFLLFCRSELILIFV